MQKVILYTKKSCPLCDDAKALLHTLQQTFAFELDERDIYLHDEWFEKYHLLIPVVQINGKEFYGNNIQLQALEKALWAG